MRSHHLQIAQLRRALIQTCGELGANGRWEPREKMMFQVEEHVESNCVLDSSTESARAMRIAGAVVMHSPYREERRETLPRCHSCIVIAQAKYVEEGKNDRENDEIGQQFSHDPASRWPAGDLKRLAMEAERKAWPAL